MSIRIIWIAYALLSAVSFAAMAACVRVASVALPQTEVVFFRNFIALLFLLPLLLHQRISLATRCFHLHLLRAISGLAAMYLYFYAVNTLHLADALLLNYTSPVFIALFAVIWLKESWTRQRRLALAISMVGLTLLFQPSAQLFSLSGFLGLASGALAGLALTTVKRLSDTDDPVSIVVWFALISSLISAVPLLWNFQWPTGTAWGWLLAVGLFGSLGQLALTRAFQRAPVTQVSPLGYTGLVFAGLIGFFVWHELPDWLGLAGMLCIVAAGVIVARERPTPALQPPSAVPVLNNEGGSKKHDG
ncbi:MAG: EamA family transporter [Zetaproteobacteria bacterium CG_4_9_14_3_um_filter_49_83]|nr:MAG: EamA family transporter [Zetaproteobacteria bacterium CG17_big_fil_post_rev_8_21_14_2_50_50_13]PIV29967.1 MAG: EamA family transporter [Zetaproteobacteria bacterium CG02_land_8_20_14_3_00_50_9]PIY56527.1 MAG: EamA family transporter [Zetaproteobacteria bacterium CG_4_10_14_0_8_um_filter_49_80]PJA35241.1 MAG: EamA family transporter [Zetaproteobacteria bacterium CG_4_9_14_3_um_filter_49_83]